MKMYACTYTHKHMLSPSFLFLFNDALNPLHFFFFDREPGKKKKIVILPFTPMANQHHITLPIKCP